MDTHIKRSSYVLACCLSVFMLAAACDGLFRQGDTEGGSLSSVEDLREAREVQRQKAAIADSLRQVEEARADSLRAEEVADSLKREAWLDETDVLVTIRTGFGTMEGILYDATSRHKRNFIKLANQGFYNGTTFHRIVKGFMIQGGDPNSKDDDPSNNGQGGPGYTIPAEILPQYRHVRGAIAGARLGDAQNPEKASSGSQFYIVHDREGAKKLDGNYTVFGQIVRGLGVLDKIAEQPVDGQMAKEKIPMTVTTRKVTRRELQDTYGVKF